MENKTKSFNIISEAEFKQKIIKYFLEYYADWTANDIIEELFLNGFTK